MAGISREVIERRMRELEEGKQPKDKNTNNVFLKLSTEEPTVLRILPPKDGDPFKEGHMHYNVGKDSGFLCPKRNFQEECAVCEYATALWRQGSSSEDAATIAMAKKYFVKPRFYSVVLVRGKEEEGPKIWGYSKNIYDRLVALMMDSDYGDISDVEAGTDLTIESKKKGDTKITDITVTPKRKSSKLFADGAEKDVEALLESMPNVSDHLIRKTPQEVQQILNKACLGDAEVDVTEDKEKYGAVKTREKEKSSVDKALAELDNTIND